MSDSFEATLKYEGDGGGIYVLFKCHTEICTWLMIWSVGGHAVTSLGLVKEGHLFYCTKHCQFRLLLNGLQLI